MSETSNSKVNSFSEFISRLSQLPDTIDKAKQEQHLKNLESNRLHDEQAEILAESLLDRKVSEYLNYLIYYSTKMFDRF